MIYLYDVINLKASQPTWKLPTVNLCRLCTINSMIQTYWYAICIIMHIYDSCIEAEEVKLFSCSIFGNIFLHILGINTWYYEFYVSSVDYTPPGALTVNVDSTDTICVLASRHLNDPFVFISILLNSVKTSSIGYQFPRNEEVHFSGICNFLWLQLYQDSGLFCIPTTDNFTLRKV